MMNNVELINKKDNLQKRIRKIKTCLMVLIKFQSDSIQEFLETEDCVTPTELVNKTAWLHKATITMQLLNIIDITIVMSNEFLDDLLRVIKNPTRVCDRERIYGVEHLKKSECWLCGRDGVCIHHLIPLCLGGRNEAYNVIPVCSDCHYLHTFRDILKVLKMF